MERKGKRAIFGCPWLVSTVEKDKTNVTTFETLGWQVVKNDIMGIADAGDPPRRRRTLLVRLIILARYPCLVTGYTLVYCTLLGI